VKKPILFAALLLVLSAVIGFAAMRPSNNRDWIAGQDRLPAIRFHGDSVSIANLRNFAYDPSSRRIADPRTAF
jgi:hypothetical protein